MNEVCIKKEIGKRLREYRHQKGMSQDGLAAISCLDQSYIGQIERGESNPTLSSLEKIVGALGISFADLFGGSSDSGNEEQGISISSLEAVLDALGISFAEIFEWILEREETPAAKCYELIRKHPQEQQEALYRALCEIERII